jgi:hypothetical protein
MLGMVGAAGGGAVGVAEPVLRMAGEHMVDQRFDVGERRATRAHEREALRRRWLVR